MSLFKQFKTIDGPITVKFKANDDKTVPAFIIDRASRSNAKWARVYEEETRPYKTEIDDKSIDESTAHMINVRIFVKALLKSWENVQDEDDKTIPFNEENAIELFVSLPELFDRLNSKANRYENYLAVNLKADEKN